MLTLPDIKAKQILFVQTERGAKNRLFFRNENIVFEKDDKIINQASCHRVFAVFIIGDFSLTTGLIKECRKRAVSLFFLNQNFGVYAALNAAANGNYLLKTAQYNTLNQDRGLAIAKALVKNKIQNQFYLIESAGKTYDPKIINETLASIEAAKKIDTLLGLEGNISKFFFQKYFSEINWWHRSPRTKCDIPNFLLDMGYTFLFNFIDAFLLLFGFDTYKGYYHQLFFQRKSLTCDIIEPFRCLIEKQLLKSYHLKQINEKDFFIEQKKYGLTYQHSQKYAKIFMEAIMDEREAIYLYIQKFYRFIMNSTKEEQIMNNCDNFPEFNIKTGQIK